MLRILPPKRPIAHQNASGALRLIERPKAQAAMLSPLGVLHRPRGTCRKARRRSVRLHEVRRMARALPCTPPCSYFVAAHGIDVSSDGRDSSASRGHAARRPGGATEYAASVLRPCAAAATHAFNGSARPLLYDRPKHRRPAVNGNCISTNCSTKSFAFVSDWRKPSPRAQRTLDCLSNVPISALYF